MSHNPMRGQKNANRRRRQVDPFSGVKHSDIMKRRGGGSVIHADVRSRITTDNGWRVEVFKSDDFEVYLEYICAKNSTGIFKNEDQERVIRVLSGSVFISHSGQFTHLLTGHSFVCKRNEEYELATEATSDAELIICQGPGYDQNMEIVRPADQANATPANPEPPIPTQITQRRGNSKAMAQAEEIQASRVSAKRTPVKKKRAPLANQVETGVNPRPVGEEGYAED